MSYGPDECEEQPAADIREVASAVGRRPVTWINVEGLGNAELIQQFGAEFGLHPLALEDTVNTHQRAKVDDYDDLLFVTIRMAQGPPLVTEQISFYVGRNFVITFQEGIEGDCLNGVRERIRHRRGRIRDGGTDYLLYELLDAVVDGYFPVLERYGELLDALDGHTDAHNIPQALKQLHDVRHDLLQLRRFIWPVRDVMTALQRGGHRIVAPETQVYLRDCYDHAAQLIDILEIYRESCSNLRDFYYSKLSNRTNEIMRTLTVIATVFMPLSFIAGVYGMNFDRMPELHWAWGYPFALGLMACTAGVFLYYSLRKGWLRSSESSIRVEPPSPRFDDQPD